MAGSKLVQLRTDLKSLKYGDDRRGSGNSGQPYIVTPIPKGSLSTSTSDDNLIRGGMFLASSASVKDAKRIQKFFKDSPRGPLFIARQIGLQLSNPKIETRKFGTGQGTFVGGLLGLGSGLLNKVNDLLPGPTRIYNAGINTLAQVPVTAMGVHYERHGLLPIQDENTKYLAVVKNNNENGNNRLIGLKNKLIKIPVAPPTNLNADGFNVINVINNTLGIIGAVTGKPIRPLFSGLSLNPQDLIIDQYNGGPGSTYGIGQTLINRYDITSNDPNKYEFQDRGVINYENTLGVSNYYTTSNTNAVGGFLGRFIPPPIKTFVNNNITNNGTSIPSLSAVRYIRNIPAGANGTSKSPTSRTYDELVRSIENTVTNNKKFPRYAVVKSPKPLSNPNFSAYFNGNKKLNVGERYDPNILSVVFTIINPFDQSEDDVIFSAYMKGFRDNFDATWNEYNYVGRSESFYTYGKHKRTVGFSLDIPCYNKEQLVEKYRGLGQLASTTAGAYSNGLLGGVLIKLNVGNHIRNEYSILNNISYEIPDESTWDIDARVAMYIKATFSFTIIQNKLPEYRKDQGFYDYMNTNLVNKQNAIVNTQKSTEYLINYFKTDPKTTLPTDDSSVVSQEIIDSLLMKPTFGVGTGFDSNADNANQILGINSIVALNRDLQRQQSNSILRRPPF